MSFGEQILEKRWTSECSVGNHTSVCTSDTNKGERGRNVGKSILDLKVDYGYFNKDIPTPSQLLEDYLIFRTSLMCLVIL